MLTTERPEDTTDRITSFRTVGIALVVFFFACDCSFAARSVAPAERPYVVLILADDLAWNDLQCYGGTSADTPHLDRLAREGMRFTQAYSPAPICSASRASILTGKLPARLHFEFVTKPSGVQPPARILQPPNYTQNLDVAEITIAERLADAGYATGFFGKWHVNEHYKRYLGWSPTHGPLRQGFQVATEAFGSHPYAGDARPWSPGDFKTGDFPKDDVTELAIDFLKDHAKRSFFLYVSHFYVHTPVKSPTDWLSDKYTNRIPSDVTNAAKRREYAAFIETLDHNVGRLLKALDEQKLTENTVVIFTSDNGGHPEYAANGPLRGSKWNLYEGGIRVPLLARWPGVIDSSARNDTPVTGTDLLPTICELAGAEVAAEEIDGASLLPVFKGRSLQEPARPLIWHFPYYHPEKGYLKSPKQIGIDDFAVSQTRPGSAIRQGDFKLLNFHEDDRIELYNLSSDPGEQNNLAESSPGLARSMKAVLSDHLKQMNARFPTPAD